MPLSFFRLSIYSSFLVSISFVSLSFFTHTHSLSLPHPPPPLYISIPQSLPLPTCFSPSTEPRAHTSTLSLPMPPSTSTTLSSFMMDLHRPLLFLSSTSDRGRDRCSSLTDVDTRMRLFPTTRSQSNLQEGSFSSLLPRMRPPMYLPFSFSPFSFPF